ncbi:MAG: hypothetical protein AAF755_13860 [Pseudomonadota bacterium]
MIPSLVACNPNSSVIPVAPLKASVASGAMYPSQLDPTRSRAKLLVPQIDRAAPHAADRSVRFVILPSLLIAGRALKAMPKRDKRGRSGVSSDLMEMRNGGPKELGVAALEKTSHAHEDPFPGRFDRASNLRSIAKCI